MSGLGGASLDELKSEFDRLHGADSQHETNVHPRRAACALKLARAHAALDMGRAVVKYGDACLAADPTALEAHLLKAAALNQMAGSKAGKAGAKALAAAEAGLVACGRVACFEHLSAARAQLAAIAARHPEAAPKPAVQRASAAPAKPAAGTSADAPSGDTTASAPALGPSVLPPTRPALTLTAAAAAATSPAPAVVLPPPSRGRRGFGSGRRVIPRARGRRWT
jgi:hypothetical protein